MYQARRDALAEALRRTLGDSVDFTAPSGGMALWTIANLVVLACTIALITAISWGLARYSRRAAAREPYPDAPADTTPTAPARAADAPAPARA